MSYICRWTDNFIDSNNIFYEIYFAYSLLSLITLSGMLSAFFRLAIALVSFRLGPSGSLRAAMSVSVSSIRASRSICSDSRIDCMDVRLLATKNLCKGVHSSSVSSLSVHIINLIHTQYDNPVIANKTQEEQRRIIDYHVVSFTEHR